MRYLKYFALLAVLTLPLAYSQAQVGVRVGVGVGPGYAGAPVCPYGYYSYYPYACAPYGYYGPQWFAGGVFIGAGPWYHSYWGHSGYWGRTGYWGRPGWGYGHGGYVRGYAGGNGFHSGGAYHGGGSFHGGGSWRRRRFSRWRWRPRRTPVTEFRNETAGSVRLPAVFLWFQLMLSFVVRSKPCAVVVERNLPRRAYSLRKSAGGSVPSGRILARMSGHKNGAVVK